MSVSRCRLFRRDIQPPSPCWELSTRNSKGSKVLVYIPRAEGRSRRRIQGSNPLTTPRLYRRTPSSRTPRSCLERENDSRPRSNSVDRVLGHQGNAGRNFKTPLTIKRNGSSYLHKQSKDMTEDAGCKFNISDSYNRPTFPRLKKNIVFSVIFNYWKWNISVIISHNFIKNYCLNISK